ncbi:hypothetical protein J3Q64DRAFT_1857384 [Phycomyces blakesleeanus]|uniref:Sulfate transporter n=1 Tax=Phycomyces blakesleeanus TaxID=4837 RepID=A0ABR3BEH4_PHYBL
MLNLRGRYRRFVEHLTIQEVSGSLGDLGTLLPVMISLAVAGQIDLTSTLWFTGIWNIASGLFFESPVCVQPMKAIAAVVLSSNMSIEENMSAGLSVAAVIFFLGATRTIHLVSNYTPTSVVRGLQLGTGVQLIKKAHDLITKLQWHISYANWSDNFTWVLLATIFVFACYRTKVPSALILFLIGLLFALIRMFVTDKSTVIPHPVAGGYYPNTIIHPTPAEFRTGFLNAGLGQIPLTCLNSVVALSILIDDLFPEKHVNTASISMSVGLMNLIGCWFGAMPVCHGAGGLAGQYRFGARSEVSVILLGLCKLLLGIIFGSSLVGLLQYFPNSLLAVMLFVSGVELAHAAQAINRGVENNTIRAENWTIMLATMGALVAFSNDGIGFVTGLVVAVLLSVQRLGVQAWWEHFVEAIRVLPSKWKDQHGESQSPCLPLHQPIALSPDESEDLGSSSISKSSIIGPR